MRVSERIYDVRMAQFVLKIETLSHIMGPRASQDLRSPSLIMAPEMAFYNQRFAKIDCKEWHKIPLLGFRFVDSLCDQETQPFASVI